MKNIDFIYILIIGFLFVTACGPTPEKAAKYNTKIVKLQNYVVNSVNDLEKSFDTFDTIKIKKALVDTEKATKKCLKILKTKVRFLGDDSSLCIGAENYFNQILSACENEYFGMYKMYCLPEERYNEDDFWEIKDKKDIRLKTAFNDFDKIQKTFANRYFIELNRIKAKN